MSKIEANKRFSSLSLGELWEYRELFLVLLQRDIKVRYKQTVLGFGWAILQPVITLIIFSVIFGRVANLPSNGYPYPLYVFSALVPWVFFSNTLSNASLSLVNSVHLISKVYFPRLLIPIASAGSWLVDLLISTTILVVLLLYYGVPVSINILLLPFLILITLFVSLGLGILFSALTVAYRDLRYALPFIVQIWLFVTPVVYPLSMLPEKYLLFAYMNPMTGVVEMFRSIILGQELDFSMIYVSFITSILIFAVGLVYFKKVERKFADII